MFLFYVGFMVVVLVPLVMFTGRSAASGGAAVMFVMVLFAALAWLAVRLSLASPLTFETRRVNLFGSFALTRGRFWPIFGTYALLIALALVVFLLITVIAVAIGAATYGDLSFFMKSQQGAGDQFTLPGLIQTAVSAVFTALLWPMALTPPAVIYQAITRGSRTPAPSSVA